MNARLRSIIALLLVLSFGLALPAVHGQQLMIHTGNAVVAPASEQPTPPCHAASAAKASTDEAIAASNDGCGQCGDGDCQCQLITLSPVTTRSQSPSPTLTPTLYIAKPAEALSLGQLRHPWRPPSSNA
ncbi:MAG: hypothetical protein II007_02285 [Gammaproteobacteria bacterium]|nr:hypothetical protein [Gammaproteobacteria bacterium]